MTTRLVPALALALVAAIAAAGALAVGLATRPVKTHTVTRTRLVQQPITRNMKPLQVAARFNHLVLLTEYDAGGGVHCATWGNVAPGHGHATYLLHMCFEQAAA